MNILRGQRIEELPTSDLINLHEQLCNEISPHADQPGDSAKLLELDMVSEELERRNERIN
jgi:hypothetical protein